MRDIRIGWRWMLVMCFAFYFLSGCIRLTGSAGYTKTKDGDTAYKAASFDTNRVVMGGNA